MSLESVTMQTRVPDESDRSPSSAAVYSIRLFVVSGWPPDSSIGAAPSGGTTMAAQPPGPGGWAAIVVPPDGAPHVELSGGAPHTTNNRMEYTAALEGLRSLPAGSRVCVVTDSLLMLKSMTIWLAGWKRRGWKTAGGASVKNQDLVLALEQEIARHAAVRWHWVRGHEVGEEHAHKALNDRADRLAVAASHAAA